MSVRVAVFALVCLAQLAVPASMILRAEETIREGRIFRFQTAPVDPVDLARGRYVRLDFPRAQDRMDVGPEDLSVGDTVYARVAESDDGFAIVTALEATPPESGDWFETVVARSNDDGVRVALPFDRFYLPEEKAPIAERLYRDSDSRLTWAEVHIHVGHAVLVDVVLNGVPMLRATQEAAAATD